VPQTESNPKERILVVDDDAITRGIIIKLLNSANYDIHEAANGRLCLDTVEEVMPHLILMDIIMPVMDGIETCRQLKSNPATQHIPVIFVTASTDDDTLAEAFRMGGGDYVRKPVNRLELLARVRSALNHQLALQKLADEEKLKGVLETAGGVCHELNQPLQYVLGAVQILMMDIPPEDPIHQRLDTIRAHVEDMGDITRRLAKITQYRSRKYAGGQYIIDISQCVGGTGRDA
jgi:CheY-like chemotaxis protein